MDPDQMTPERWQRTRDYITTLFAPQPRHERDLMHRATAAGMPAIDAGPETGRLLQLLVTLTGGRLAVEIGTLAGASTIWMARGLAPGGKVITVELSSKHADFARREIDAAGVGDRVTIRQGRGLEVLPALVRELGTAAAGLVFFDAERAEYPALVDHAHALLKPHAILAVDNALAAKTWTADPVPPAKQPDEMDTFNRQMAADPRFLCTLLPVGNGVLIAMKL